MVEFNRIPGTIIAPIVTFEVNSGGQFENRSRLLLIGSMATASGALVAGEITPCPSIAEAIRLAGSGSMLHDMVVMARLNAPAQEIWIASPDLSAGTAEVRTVTVTTLPAAGTGTLLINGETVQVTVNPGDDDDAVAASIHAAIGGYFNRLTSQALPFSSAVATNVVTLTAKYTGASATEIPIQIPDLGGSNVFSGKLTVATTTAGVGAADISAILAGGADEEYDWVVSGYGDDTNLGRLKSWLSDISGRWAWNRQVYGHAFLPKRDTIGNLTTAGLAVDDRHITLVPTVASAEYPQAPWIWVSAIAARIVPWLSDGSTGNVSRNQTGLAVAGLIPPASRADWPDYATRDAFLGSGLSTWKVTGSGIVTIDKIVTTARTLNDVPDTVFRDIQRIGQAIYGLRFLRAQLAYEHSNKIVADDNPANLPAISTPRDIKATYMHAYEQLVDRGVFENAARAADHVDVRRNADNPNRVDILAPIDAANPLDIIAANARVYSQFQ